MDIIDIIKDIKGHRSKVEALQERILRLRSIMEIGSRQLSDMPGAKGAVKDRLSENIAKLDELECSLVNEIVFLEDNIRIAETVMESLSEKEQKVMRLRHIDGFRWRKVAEIANYNEDYCKQIESKALKKISEK